MISERDVVHAKLILSCHNFIRNKTKKGMKWYLYPMIRLIETSNEQSVKFEFKQWFMLSEFLWLKKVFHDIECFSEFSEILMTVFALISELM